MINKYKPIIISMFGLLSVFITLASNFISLKFELDIFDRIITSIALMAIAIPIHLFSKHFTKGYMGYISCWLLNSVGMGFAVSAFYIHRGYIPDIKTVVAAILPAVIVILAAGILLHKFPDSKKLLLIIAVILSVLLLTISVIIWRRNEPFSSFAVFSLVIALIWLGVFRLAMGSQKRYLFRDISFGGFGAVIIIVIVVLPLVSEGDAVPDFVPDFGGEADPKSKKKK